MLMSVFSLLTNSVSPEVTVTVPVTPPGFKVNGRLLVLPTSSSTFSEVESANPEAFTLTS